MASVKAKNYDHLLQIFEKYKHQQKKEKLL